MTSKLQRRGFLGSVMALLGLPFAGKAKAQPKTSSAIKQSHTNEMAVIVPTDYETTYTIPDRMVVYISGRTFHGPMRLVCRTVPADGCCPFGMLWGVSGSIIATVTRDEIKAARKEQRAIAVSLWEASGAKDGVLFKLNQKWLLYASTATNAEIRDWLMSFAESTDRDVKGSLCRLRSEMSDNLRLPNPVYDQTGVIS